MTMQADCKCGWTEQMLFAPDSERNTRKTLEVLADRHETENVRRAYRHDTKIWLAVR